jgi:hypothetical protein
MSDLEQIKLISDLLLVLPKGITADTIIYALQFTEHERERKRLAYKPTGKPPGRPRKSFDIEISGAK